MSEVRTSLSTSLSFFSVCHPLYSPLHTDPPPKKQKMSDTTASTICVAIELGYQDLMTDEVCHLSPQFIV